MFTPRVPLNQQPTGEIIPTVSTPGTVAPQNTAQAPCGCPHHTPAPTAPAASRPTVQLTPGSIALLVGGGTAAVLVIGAVLVSMLLAVAITAGSLAIVAIVVRSLINSEIKHR
ncbi:SpdD-like protein [Streptomyces longispororuber]|uniref:SpdD-like protein n=1 Tax=Streptomyces longispororuber TaxID=68230 RepID=UPI00210DB9B2|nr:SpdD-like protein [Streptomyces longispororuber]MCQ4214473.1 SpdD-like protein [Streptomyces longispororuber]